jgi:hypothetical protein
MTPYTSGEVLELLKVACTTRHTKTFTAAPDVVAWLMTVAPEREDTIPWQPAPLYRLMEVPVIEAGDMPPGQFQLVTHDNCLTDAGLMKVVHAGCTVTEGTVEIPLGDLL